MADLKATLYDLARAIVDNPDDVTVVVESETVDSINFVLSVSPDDMGMVIGRNGRIARAIRTVMKAAGNTCGKRVNVEIR
ncbi:MAG: KH domain-containing protein [Clostridiales bacterium]|nr:KH domain-containing protein [Clostridiales bacterium]HOA85633.1 KH domain-containing protein [Bacillota bacterium]